MNRQWAIVGVVLGLIVLLIGLGWLVRDRFAPVESGTPAPDFVATDMEGNEVRLADLKGEVILLNVWATWCGPCREEMPSMQDLHERLGDRGLKVVAVSVDAPLGGVDVIGNPGGNVRDFLDTYGLTFTVWRNPSGDIQRTYRTTGVPESWVIDRTGTIVSKKIGAEDWASEARIALFERLLEG